MVSARLAGDAIVEIENIARHARSGKSIRQAAGDAVTEIVLAVIATTFALVAVFFPTAAMSGIPGLFFRQFGWTAVVAVLASLLVARLLTPMLAVFFLKSHPQAETPEGNYMRRYIKMVSWTLANRRTSLNFELPPGSSLDDSVTVAESIRKSLAQAAGIDHTFAAVGNSQATGGVRKGSVLLSFADRALRPLQAEIERGARQALQTVPGARFSISTGGPGGKFALILASDNENALKSTAQAVERELRNVGTLSNINSTADLESPEIIIRPDWHRAADLGVTAELIGETVRIATSGDFDNQLAKLNLDNRQLYIRVRMADTARRDLEAIANLRVRSRTGLVPLASVAKLSLESGSTQIDRYDRQRFVTINAELTGMPLGQAMKAAQALPAVIGMPSSVHLIQTGDAEVMKELMGGFGMAMLTGIVCVFCVLVLLFKDFFQPITILSAIPLSLGGAIDACHKRARPIVMTTVAMIAGMLPIALGIGTDSGFRQPMATAVIGGLICSTLLCLLVVPVIFTYVNDVERWLKSLWGKPAT